MKYEAEIRELLINNAIQLIAEGGFEKATTKELAHCGNQTSNFKMNEAYIYRTFGSKEKLYEAAFLTLENELYHALNVCVTEEFAVERDMGQTWERIYERAWAFLKRNEARCRCYVRYYYSIYFRGASLELHREHFDKVLVSSGLSSVFLAEADVRSIMRSVFTALLDFAIRVYNGELADSEVNRRHIFNVLYCMMSSYLKEEARCDTGRIRTI